MKKTKKIGTSFILVAALIALLGTTTVLAVTFNWHEKLIAYLNPSETQQQEMAGNVTTPNVTVTKNGVTVTAKQAVVDGLGMYVLCDITAPEGFVFSDKVYFNTVDVTFEGQGASNGWETIEESGNKRTVIIYATTNGKIENHCNVKLTIGGLYYAEYFDDGSYDVHTLIEGDLDLAFRIDYTDLTKTIAVNKKVKINDTNDNTITTVSISPTSVLIRIVGDDVWTAFQPVIKMKNGEEIVLENDNHAYSVYDWHNLDVTNEMGRFNEDGSVRRYGEYVIGHRFKSITNSADIESIVIGDVILPIN